MGKTWRTRTDGAVRPLARAVRTKSSVSTSRTAERRTRLTLAAENQPRVQAGAPGGATSRPRGRQEPPPGREEKDREETRPERRRGLPEERRQHRGTIEQGVLPDGGDEPRRDPDGHRDGERCQREREGGGQPAEGDRERGRLNPRDSPKSPRTTRARYATYWTGIGRSKPYARRSRATSSALAVSDTMRLTGSPDSRTATNTTVDTPQTTRSAWASFRRAYRGRIELSLSW